MSAERGTGTGVETPIAESTPAVEVPMSVRLRLGRAAVQDLADRAAVDMLHLKGDAVDLDLRPEHAGTDIDVLVRPGHESLLDDALRGHGWEVYSTFEWGSPFGHAQTYFNPTWGFLDLHRRFPGVGLDPATAFDLLWSQRGAMDFGGVVCQVPDSTAQAVILVINGARTEPRERFDVTHIWGNADDAARSRLRQGAARLHAQLAFDTAIGELHRHRGAREYALWKSVSEGGSRTGQWAARVAAAKTLRERAAVIARAPMVNIAVLSHRLGRRAGPIDVAVEFFARPVRALRELCHRGAR